MRRTGLVSLLLLVGCHGIVAIEAPPRGEGRTGLWLVARSDAVVDGRVSCAAGDSEPCLEAHVFALARGELPRIPAFARRGTVHLAYVELACSLEVLGLDEGVQTLRERPQAASVLPRALTAHTWSSDDAGWVEATTEDAWITAAQQALPFPDNLKCRARGMEMRVLGLPQRTVRSLVEVPGGDVLLIADRDSIRFSDRATSDPVSLSSTASPSLGGAGYVDGEGQLWVVAETGRVYRTPLSDRMVAPAVGRTFAAPWARAASAGPRSFFVSSAAEGASILLGHGARTAVARYDRQTQQWDLLHYATTSSVGISLAFVDMLALDEDRVVVAGADSRIVGNDIDQLTGQGRLLEATRTSSTWISLVTRAGVPAFALSVADTEQHGVIAGALVCADPRTCLSDDVLVGTLFERRGEQWVELPDQRYEVAPFAIASGGPRATWTAGTRRSPGPDFSTRVTARFDDALECSAVISDFPLSVARIVPLGERGLLVQAYTRRSEELQFRLLPAREVDADCMASAF